MDSDEEFAIVFGAMGLKYDVAEYFRKTFEESGASDHVVMFTNLANDPVLERLITPKVALTTAEYLAFEKGMSGHDDSPDADEGAIYKLQQRSRQSAWEPSIGTVKNSKYIW